MMGIFLELFLAISKLIHSINCNISDYILRELKHMPYAMHGHVVQ